MILLFQKGNNEELRMRNCLPGIWVRKCINEVSESGTKVNMFQFPSLRSGAMSIIEVQAQIYG